MEREGLASSALKYKVHQYVGDRGDGNKDDEFFALEPYHSHFILVDNHAIGKRSYGSEISFRVQMEEALCQDNEENDEVIAVPKVLLVLGGGKGTFSNVLAALEEDRPVVVVPESEGAALSIYEVCCGTEDAQALFDSEPPTDDEQVMMRALLVEIAEINKQYKGLRDTAVCYWGLNDHWETEPLRDVILKSLLDDLKDQPCDAVRLAVTWKDSELVKGELEDLQINDKAGVVYAFTHALSLAETQVLQVLVDFKIRASQVRLNDLVLKEKEPGRLSQNIDELDHHNFLIVKDADASKLREEFKIDENSLVRGNRAFGRCLALPCGALRSPARITVGRITFTWAKLASSTLISLSAPRCLLKGFAIKEWLCRLDVDCLTSAPSSLPSSSFFSPLHYLDNSTSRDLALSQIVSPRSTASPASTRSSIGTLATAITI
mmetsp:Transcript_17312/g.37171  ORF Transcript_17312/g.37171 Transcript_17312/m.37171 type:complete len:435 (+) Transcript_17312:107-1411(+)